MENREGGKPIDTSMSPCTCSHALLYTQVMTRTLPHLNSNIVPLLRPSIYVHAAAFETPQGTSVLISVSLFIVNNLFLRMKLLMCHHRSSRPVTSQKRLCAWCNSSGSSNSIQTCFERWFRKLKAAATITNLLFHTGDGQIKETAWLIHIYGSSGSLDYSIVPIIKKRTKIWCPPFWHLHLS